ncbi:unnamed protein product, partial [marine sediment metagenome]
GLNSPLSRVECINDIDSEIINFFQVLQAPDTTKALLSKLQFIPYSRQVYADACLSEVPQEPVLRAKRFFIMAKMAWGGYRSGGQKTGQSPGRWRFSVGNHCTGAKEVKQFRRTIDGLDLFAKRLLCVYIEQSNFRKVLKQWDRPYTFFFVDPPYMGTEGYYGGDFSEDDHKDLAKLLNTIQGKAMITYYPNSLVDELYPVSVWRRIPFSSTKNAHCSLPGTGKEKVTEVALLNYELDTKQMELFS